MLIRKAIKTDYEVFHRLNLEIQDLHAQAAPELFKSTQAFSKDTDRNRGDFEKILSNENDFVFIAEDQGEVLGYIYGEYFSRPESHYRHALKLCFIHHLGIEQSQRGKGIGKLLVGHTKEEARKLGVARIELDVWSFNAKALDFYRKNGFEIFNERLSLKIE